MVYSSHADISNGVKQPTYRFPPGNYQKTYKFIPLRQVHSSAATSSRAAPAAQQAFPVTVPARTFQPVVGASAASSSGGWRPQLRPVDHAVQPRSQTPQGTPRSRSQTRTSESVRPPRPTRPCPRPIVKPLSFSRTRNSQHARSTCRRHRTGR